MVHFVYKYSSVWVYIERSPLVIGSNYLQLLVACVLLTANSQTIKRAIILFISCMVACVQAVIVSRYFYIQVMKHWDTKGLQYFEI